MLALLLVLLPTDQPATDQPATESAWSGFLGPPSGAVQAGDLPVEWSPDSVAYTIELDGYGQSSPVVRDGILYLTSVEGDNKETNRVSAYQLSDGSPLWSQTATNPTPEPNNFYVSRAAPTPVVDESGVVAFFEGGRLLAYDAAGNERWNRDLVADFGPIKARHGLSASLVQDAEHVFVHVERESDPYLLAVRKSDGTDAWKVPGLGSSTWASPVMLDGPDGQPHLVVSAVGQVAGFDPASGERLWTLDGLSGNSAATPYPVGPGQFLVGGSGGRMDPNAAASNGLIEVTRTGDGYAAAFKWQADKARSSFGSPIAAGDLAYFTNRSGAVFAYDVATGEPAFTKRVAESGWATPLATEDRIYFVGKDGTTTVVSTGREFDKLAENRLWEPEAATGGFGSGPVQYAVAAVDGTLLVRRGDRLYAIRR